MAAKFSQNLEDNVKCPICLGQYQDPRTLSCLHTYCKGCLEQVLGKDLKLECPECREVTKVDDVSSLRVNIWVIRDIDLLKLFTAEKNQDGKPQLTCDNCDSKEPAKARCFVCEKYMCNSCVAAHNRMTVLRDHKLVSLEDIDVSCIPVVTEKQSLCDKHKGKKQKLFCEDCGVYICKDCIIIDHKEHCVSFLADVAERHKEKLRSEMISANDVEQKIESALNTVRDMKEKLRKKSKDIEQEIDAIIDAKIQVLEERRAASKQESRNTIALKMQRLSTQEDGLLMHSAVLKSAVHFTENLLKNGNTREIISMKEELFSRMSTLCQKDIDDEVDKEDQVEVKSDDQDFLRLEDEGAPDPKQCTLSTIKEKTTNKKATSLIAIEVKNFRNTPIFLKKSRITVHITDCPLLNVNVIDLKSVSKQHNNGIEGNFVLERQQSHHNLRRGKLEVLVDGQPINGSPFKVWGY